MVLLVILLIAVVNFMIGTFIPPSDTKLQKGVTGYTSMYNTVIFSHQSLYVVKCKIRCVAQKNNENWRGSGGPRYKDLVLSETLSKCVCR